MFKYSNKQQLRSLGERCKLYQRSPGRNPGRESIFWTNVENVPENVPSGNNYGYFRLHKHVHLKPKTAKYIIA